jgi:putative PIG3 family NAD(P)H quinone oxidoreductase
MRAIHVEHGPGGPELSWRETPDPRPAAGEVLIEVRAAGVNRADLAQAAGRYAPPPGASTVLGLEVAGVVRKAAGGWRAGDRVMALLSGGGYAELAAADPRLLVSLPGGWSFVQGAAVPEAWLTAYLNLMIEARLRAGERVLVHAAASGVGTAALQIARRAHSEVYATCGGDRKVELCRALGAEAVFDRSAGDFAAPLLAATAGDGVDVVLDPVGGPYLAANLSVLREHGRLVCIGLLGGGRAEIDLAAVLGRSLEIRGSRLRPRAPDDKARIVEAFVRDVWPALRSGDMRVVIDRSFPVEAAAQAHDHVRSNSNAGKVVLEVG